jgi:hypothetical protein
MSPRTPHAPFGAETVLQAVTAIEGAALALRAAIARGRLRRGLARLSARERADVGMGERPARPVRAGARTGRPGSRDAA